MSYGKIDPKLVAAHMDLEDHIYQLEDKLDPKLEATQLSREDILARLDKLEADLNAAIAQVRRELKRERQQKVESVIKWWITPLT